MQSATKLFEHLRLFVSKISYLMQFYEINISQVKIYRLFTAYKKHGMVKIGNKTREKLLVVSQVLK